MKMIPSIALAALSFMSCSNSGNNSGTTDSNAAKSATPQNGWVSLFDGKTLKGWHLYGNKNAPSVWKVVDGAIAWDPTAKRLPGDKLSNDLVSDDSYGNFDFKYEWKISKNGNSGLIFWVQEDSAKFKQTYHTGPEMQVLDNDGHADGKINKHRAGNLYDLIAGTEGAVKPVGEWNQAEIISDHGKLSFMLNGVTVLTTRYDDDNWKQMIAGSKFKQWPAFATVFNGHFALQDHGNDVWYRNIMVKNL
jgi:hypothetical protein